MKNRENGNTILKDFENWVKQPSPTGFWLYRGQSEIFTSILPSILRDSTKQLYGRRMLQINPVLTHKIFESSLVISPQKLYSCLIHDQHSQRVSNFIAENFGIVTTDLPDIHLDELIQALAQHYDYPTLFVDLTANPYIAAFFALRDIQQSENAQGRVFRWPVIKKTEARYILPFENEKLNTKTELSIINLQIVNKLIRRPHNQEAFVIKTVSIPSQIFPPTNESLGQGFRTSIDELEITDLMTLNNCESFSLPYEVKRFFDEQHGMTEDYLFPNKIDLGYSYLTMLSIFSLIIVHPSEILCDNEEVNKSLESQFNRGFQLCRYILDRECFRLVPNVPVTKSMQENLNGFIIMFHEMVKIGRQAASMMNDPENIDTSSIDRAKENYVKEKYLERLESFRKAVENSGKTLFNYEDLRQKIQEMKITQDRGNKQDVIDNIDKKFPLALQIIEDCDKIPIYSFENPQKYSVYFDIFENSPEYEKKVKKQIEQHKKKQSSLFN